MIPQLFTDCAELPGSRFASRNGLKASESETSSHLAVSSVLSSGTVMLDVLLLLSLTSPVVLVPPPGAPPVPCRRCCDDVEPEEGSGAEPPIGVFSHVPEVRTYINMTILKGNSMDHFRSHAKWQYLLAIITLRPLFPLADAI